MDHRSLANRLLDARPLVRRATLAALLVLYGIVCWSSLELRNPELAVTLWWPAAGLGVIIVLVTRGTRLSTVALVAVTNTAVHLLHGSPVGISIGFGIANAVEAYVLVLLLTGGRSPVPALDSLRRVSWFLLCAMAGLLSYVLVGAIAIVVFTDSEPFASMLSLLASHGSALLAIAPIALVPTSRGSHASVLERAAQAATLAILIAAAFFSDGVVPLVFVILGAVLWAAFRMPPLFLAVEIAALAVLATSITLLGHGPFFPHGGEEVRTAVLSLQLFIVAHAAAGLFVSGSRQDWLTVVERLAEREQAAIRVVEELRQLNLQKDDFISAVSHELRTPVTSIIGFSEQLDQSELSPEGRQASTIIARNARRLSDVIEDVLELSRITTQGAAPQSAFEVDLSRLLRVCTEDAQGLAPERRIRFEVTVPEQPVVIRTVEHDLHRVIANLLSNAVKFSPKGSTVEVELLVGDEHVELRIQDHGIGIPLEEIDEVWERFYRVQTDAHRGVPGTGLGLPIVRGLVESSLGGRVELHSDGQQGTLATVRLPTAIPPAAARGRASAGQREAE